MVCCYQQKYRLELFIWVRRYSISVVKQHYNIILYTWYCPLVPARSTPLDYLLIFLNVLINHPRWPFFPSLSTYLLITVCGSWPASSFYTLFVHLFITCKLLNLPPLLNIYRRRQVLKCRTLWPDEFVVIHIDWLSVVTFSQYDII